MKRMLLVLVLVALVLAGCGKPEMTAAFREMDVSDVTRVQIQNLHNGKYSLVTDPESLEEICAYVKGVSGVSGESGKGYYEGSYAVALYAEGEEPFFNIGFGDEDVFYYGEGADGYPIRYHLVDLTIKDTTAFFSRFDSSVTDSSDPAA